MYGQWIEYERTFLPRPIDRLNAVPLRVTRRLQKAARTVRLGLERKQNRRRRTVKSSEKDEKSPRVSIAARVLSLNKPLPPLPTRTPYPIESIWMRPRESLLPPANTRVRLPRGSVVELSGEPLLLELPATTVDVSHRLEAPCPPPRSLAQPQPYSPVSELPPCLQIGDVSLLLDLLSRTPTPLAPPSTPRTRPPTRRVEVAEVAEAAEAAPSSRAPLLPELPRSVEEWNRSIKEELDQVIELCHNWQPSVPARSSPPARPQSRRVPTPLRITRLTAHNQAAQLAVDPQAREPAYLGDTRGRQYTRVLEIAAASPPPPGVFRAAQVMYRRPPTPPREVRVVKGPPHPSQAAPPRLVPHPSIPEKMAVAVAGLWHR